jgi:hypothetical protein
MPDGRSMDRLVIDLTNELAQEFGHSVPPEVIRRTVTDSFGSFAESRISVFVPTLARRQARAHLRRYAAVPVA